LKNAQRFAACRSGGILVQMFTQRTSPVITPTRS
jgi:hypothetical protein